MAGVGALSDRQLEILHVAGPGGREVVDFEVETFDDDGLDREHDLVFVHGTQSETVDVEVVV